MTGPRPKLPTDTVALKRKIAADSTKGANLTQTSADALAKGNKVQARTDLSAAVDANVSAGQGRETLNQARAGTIPAVPKRPVNRKPDGSAIHHDDPDE